MATAQQIEANRRNAQNSTGPRTEEGKRNSSLNAYRHGFTGQTLLMTAEQAEARDGFVEAIINDLKPVGAMEEQLARSIADSHWRMNRIGAIEDNIFASEAWNRASWAAKRAAEKGTECRFDAVDQARSQMESFTESNSRFQLLTVYEMRLHRKAQADLKQLRAMQAERRASGQQARDENPRPEAVPNTTTQGPSAPQSAESTTPNVPNGFVCSTGRQPSEPAPPFVCGPEAAPPNFAVADPLAGIRATF